MDKIPKKLLIILIIILFVILLTVCALIVGYFLINKQGRASKIVTKTPVASTISKTKKIIKTNEEKITIVDNNGVKITLYIPPDSLEKDTELTLTALSEPPIGGLRPDAVIPGVMISPANIAFRLPATLVFDFNPVNDQITIPKINLPTIPENDPNQPFNLPEINPVEQEVLSSEEQQRRQHAPQRQFGQTTGVIYTNGSSNQPGSAVFVPSSTTDSDNGTIQTQVDNSGTYSPIPQVEQEEAKAIIERVLADPNATPQQIIEAAGLAQAWGFDDLEQKALAKIKETMKSKVKEMTDNCASPEGTPVSKSQILKIQTLVQALGFTVEDLSLSGLLETCKKKYTMEFSYHDWGRTDTYKAKVCGFVDDQWTMEIGLAWDCGGGGSVNPFSFSLAPFGGLTTVTFPWSGSGCACGNCSSLTNSSASLLFNYDGIKTVIISQAASATKTVQIQQQGFCQN
ncbi:hypothetical protein MUP32_06245 [Candidatus Microgenomates bacterium]|nr:hypothetical protein [Candidatus Microgenomates bacterium]